jgi:hypothetical protein
MSAAPPRVPRADPPADDRDLRAALQALPPDVDTALLRSLEQRVLGEWAEQVVPALRAAGGSAGGAERGGERACGAGVAVLGHGSGPGPGPGPGFGRLRWLVVALTIVGVIGALLWLQRPDPVLDELLRVDVLSQMAAGEM